jgi:hypothetical protein
MSGLRLTSAAGEVKFQSRRDWNFVCSFAEAFGWEAAGTRMDGAGPYWCGSYSHDGYHSAYIAADDARALAVALNKVDLRSFPETMLNVVAHVCASGPVTMTGGPGANEVPAYCYCQMVRSESFGFDDLDLARTSAWAPREDFDAFMVFAAVRAQVHERCWARHLETREALAQAICGYLDRHPEDAAFSNARLLGAVQREFYGGPPATGDRLDEYSWSRVRPYGAQFMLRNAAERLAFELPAPASVRQLASQGPWWRAARIMGDHDIALIAAGVEWVYQRGVVIDATFRKFWPGENPPMAEIPTLDFDRVRADIFGKDRDRWPGTCPPAHDRDDEAPWIAELEYDEEREPPLYIVDVADPGD